MDEAAKKEISRTGEAREGRVYVCSPVISANGKTSGIPPGRQPDRRLLMQPLCYIKRNCGMGKRGKSFGRSTLPGAGFLRRTQGVASRRVENFLSRAASRHPVLFFFPRVRRINAKIYLRCYLATLGEHAAVYSKLRH